MKVFIIPGLHNYPSKEIYKRIQKLFESRGDEVKIFWPKWAQNVSGVTKDFLDFFDDHKESQNALLGFSYGAMVAFKTATKRNVDELILCSLSPYFAEDWKTLPIHYKLLKLLRLRDFYKNWKFEEMAAGFSTKTTLLYGTKEPACVARRTEEYKEQLPNISTVVTVENSPHNIADEAYFTALKKVIGE